MVSSVYKWFATPLFSVFLLAGGNGETPVAGSPAQDTDHPFHVSVVEIEHNAADRTLEISCKIFTDDFEMTLANLYKTKVDLINPPQKAAMDTLVKKYIRSHFSLKVNGRPVAFNYIGYENEKEAAYGYIEVENISSVSKLEMTNTILFDEFIDQMNIMHVKAGGNRKSTKLNYPDKEAVFTF